MPFWNKKTILEKDGLSLNRVLHQAMKTVLLYCCITVAHSKAWNSVGTHPVNKP